jgi:hypothetical protein
VFTIALTVEGPGGLRRDVVARASGTQTVGELAARLAQYLGLEAVAGPLLVHRTGERLDPGSPLAEADLLEGDIVSLEAGAQESGAPGAPRAQGA